MTTKNKNITKPIIIAGPCAAESAKQIEIAICEGKKRNIDFLRVNLWKPRTKPGFDGLGGKGIPILVKTAKSGLNPALEVIIPEHAQIVMNAVLPVLKENGKLLLWVGARNQNHFLQKEIACIASKDPRVYLLIKNQPWVDEKHWEGITEHALSGGINKKNLILCHRGFIPNGHNPLGLRNVPDYEMAMRIKTTTALPMVFDPSHTGGSVANVFKVAEESIKYDFDGCIVEVHHDPRNALTDAKQQLTWEEFDRMIKVYAKN